MRKILLVRHGESTSNAGGITVPHGLIPLTALGADQARALAERLSSSPTRILSSPFVRAVETARPYADRTGKTVELEPLLQEFDMFDYSLIAGMNQAERRPIADAFWREGDPSKRAGERAESFGDFAGRVSLFLKRVLPDLPDGTVCFGHGIWIGMVAWQLLGFATDSGQAMRQFRCFQSGLPLPNAVTYQLAEASLGLWVFKAVSEP